MRNIIRPIIFVSLFFGFHAHATKCGEFIYNKYGMYRHYEWLPNTASENTKKNGLAMSTIKPSTETSTASSDPGVSTGTSTASTQSWSSYGDCSFWGQIKDSMKASYRHIYIEENLDGIKKQAALGTGGGHMDSIALMSNCSMQAGSRLGALLQKNYATICDYDPAHSTALVDYIDTLIKDDPELKDECPQTAI